MLLVSFSYGYLLVSDSRQQSAVFGQPDDIIYTLAFTPAQHFMATETTIAPEDDLDLWPTLAQPLHQ